MVKKGCKFGKFKSSGKCRKTRLNPEKREEQERKKLVKELQSIGKFTSSQQPKEISFWSKKDRDRHRHHPHPSEKIMEEQAERSKKETERIIKLMD